MPGNETAIFELQNALAEAGIEVITDHDHEIHVSGHPGRGELVQMYQWVRPRVAVPVHGEARHLAAHAEIAKECQVPQQIVGRNGMRSEEHTSELQSLMRISYAVFCLKKKQHTHILTT